MNVLKLSSVHVCIWEYRIHLVLTSSTTVSTGEWARILTLIIIVISTIKSTQLLDSILCSAMTQHFRYVDNVFHEFTLPRAGREIMTDLCLRVCHCWIFKHSHPYHTLFCVSYNCLFLPQHLWSWEVWLYWRAVFSSYMCCTWVYV